MAEVDHIISTLRLNGYSKPFLSKHVSLHSDKKVNPPDPPQWKSTAVLPYVRGISEAIRRVLIKLQIRVCFKPVSNLRCIFPSPKDRPSKTELSSVVYKIPCANCRASYIGQTKRKLKQRISEHKRAVSRADFSTSALAEHAWTCEHPVDWKNVEVLSNARDDTPRIIQEAVYIRTTSDTLNRDNGALPVEYDNLLHKHLTIE